MIHTNPFKNQDNTNSGFVKSSESFLNKLFQVYKDNLTESPAEILRALYFHIEDCPFIPIQFEWDQEKQKILKKPLVRWKNTTVRERTEWLEKISENFRKGIFEQGIAIILDGVPYLVLDIDDVVIFSEKVQKVEGWLAEICKVSPLVTKTLQKGYHCFLPRHFFAKFLETINNAHLRTEYGFEIRHKDLLLLPPSRFAHNGKTYEYKILYVNPENLDIEEGNPALLKILEILAQETEIQQEMLEEKILEILEQHKDQKKGEKEEDKSLQEIIREIKKKISFEALIPHKLHKRYGRYSVLHCPFHEPDSTPSFAVYRNNDGEELGIDFHTGEVMDVITFWEKYQGVDFLVAIKELCEKAGVVLEKKKTDRDKIQEHLNLYRQKGSLVFHVIITKKGIKEELIGPAVSVQALVKDIQDQDMLYLCRYESEEFLMRLGKKDISDIVSAKTGRAVVSEQKFREFLTLQAELCREKKLLLKATGWLGDEFFHPLIQNSGQYLWKIPQNDMYIRRDPQKQHELVLAALREGKILGVLYVLALSSLFCRKNGYTIFVTGPSGQGKTLSCILATNLFYDCTNNYVTTNATLAGAEVMLKSIRHMPILFDELSLKTIEEEKLVFMIAAGKGKARATKTLELNVTNIGGAIFITSERSPQLQTPGAFRRCLWISVEDTRDFTEIFSIRDRRTIAKYLSLVGAGVDYIPVVKNIVKNPLPIDEGFEEFNSLTYIESIYHALKTLELFHGERFDSLRKTITEKLFNHLQEFEKKVDLINYFIEKFSEFILNKRNYFIREYTIQHKVSRANTYGGEYDDTIDEVAESYPETREIYGKIYENGNIFILTKVFDSFCNEYSFDKRILLKKIEEEGILKVERDGRYVTRETIAGLRYHGYYLFGKKIFYEENDFLITKTHISIDQILQDKEFEGF